VEENTTVMKKKMSRLFQEEIICI